MINLNHNGFYISQSETDIIMGCVFEMLINSDRLAHHVHIRRKLIDILNSYYGDDFVCMTYNKANSNLTGLDYREKTLMHNIGNSTPIDIYDLGTKRLLEFRGVGKETLQKIDEWLFLKSLPDIDGWHSFKDKCKFIVEDSHV